MCYKEYSYPTSRVEIVGPSQENKRNLLAHLVLENTFLSCVEEGCNKNPG